MIEQVISKNPVETKNININVMPFDGSPDRIKWFFEQVKDVKKINGWDENVALIFMKSKLTGNALQFCANDPATKSVRTIDEAEKAITSFFCDQRSQTSNWLALQQISLLPNESVRSVAHRISTAVAKAFPESTDEVTINRIKTQQLITALPLEIKTKIINENINDFEEMMNRAAYLQTAMESLQLLQANSLIGSPPILKTNVIQKEVTQPQVICQFCGIEGHVLAGCSEFNKKFDETRQVNTLVQRENFPNREIFCIFCQKIGHSMAQCYYFNNSMQFQQPTFQSDQFQNLPRVPFQFNPVRAFRGAVPRADFRSQNFRPRNTNRNFLRTNRQTLN